jgi:hypothetical protein
LREALAAADVEFGSVERNVFGGNEHASARCKQDIAST